MKHLLSHMTWVEARDAAQAGRVAIVPIGSIEGNGPRNVTGYDFFVSNALAREAAERTGSVWLPAVPYGIPDGLENFPGTIAMTVDIMVELVESILRSLIRGGFKHILLITNHGPNQYPTEVACRNIGKEAGLVVASINPAAVATDLRGDLFKAEEIGHGSEPGTSLMMHLQPGMVRAEVGETRTKNDWQGLEVVSPSEVKFGDTRINLYLSVEELSPTSSWGDHSLANAERGKVLFGRMLDHVCGFIERFKTMDTRLSRPAPVAERTARAG